MKKVISAILLSAMLLTLGACASGGGSTTPKITTEGVQIQMEKKISNIQLFIFFMECMMDPLEKDTFPMD